MLLTFESDILFDYREEHALCNIFCVVRVTGIDPGDTIDSVYLPFIYLFYQPFPFLIDHCSPLPAPVILRSYYIYDP